MILRVTIEMDVVSRDESDAIQRRLLNELGHRYFHRHPAFKVELTDTRNVNQPKLIKTA